MHKLTHCIRTEQPRWRVWLWAACEAFVLYSMLRALRLGPASDALICLLVALGAAVPYLFQAFGYRMSNALFLFGLFYLLASMSGRVYKLYYLIAHWDKLLHLCGGVIFALFGSYLPVLIRERYRDDLTLRALFAVLFSISVAVLWEFYEFGMDRWFGMDMQRDTVISAIHSYDLGSAAGVIGSIDRIDSVIVNGQPMAGYLDIGLIDTMGDMFIETVGAVAYAVLFALDRGRHAAITRTADARPDKREAARAKAE